MYPWSQTLVRRKQMLFMSKLVHVMRFYAAKVVHVQICLCDEVLRMPWTIVLTVCSEMRMHTDIISSPLPP